MFAGVFPSLKQERLNTNLSNSIAREGLNSRIGSNGKVPAVLEYLSNAIATGEAQFTGEELNSGYQP